MTKEAEALVKAIAEDRNEWVRKAVVAEGLCDQLVDALREQDDWQATRGWPRSDKVLAALNAYAIHFEARP